MLVVVGILIMLMTLIITTVVMAVSDMRASGSASGLAGFLRDAQIHAVQTGHVVVLRADQITPVGKPAYWQLTGWVFPTDADALLKTRRGDSNNANDWPQSGGPVVSFDLDPSQDLYGGAKGFIVPDNPATQSVLILPDGTANQDVVFIVFDRHQAEEGITEGTQVELQHATGRVYLEDTRHQWTP